MKFLVDTLDGKTIEADMVDDMLETFYSDDILYVDGVVCKLSTARSMEAEAVKEATALIRNFVFEDLLDADEWERVQAWLEKWDAK